MSAQVRTTCPYCGVGCGVLAQKAEDGGWQVRGDPDHPANRGRLCSKGTALGATLGEGGRLLQPQVDGQNVEWEAALDTVASRLRSTIERHGPESVALYVSGQLLTEDYYVANKLMKGYVGTANIDTNSRLCMSSAVSGHVRAFGEDVVPVDYQDLDTADLLVLVGSNLAWCHPVLMQRIQAERERRPQLRVIAVDPRRTATVELSDMHLPLRSGTDVMLFNGLLVWLAEHGARGQAFVDSHTEGLSGALQAARVASSDVQATAQACGLDPALVQQFFTQFAATERVVTLFSQGVNQSSVGADKVNSIINCHLVTGRIGRPGMGPFSITGQPNAMGGREVGGLASQLAVHLHLQDPAHREAVQAFWSSPRIASQPGLKAVEMFEAVHDGRIKAIWIMATNPIVSLPDADRVRAALANCPLVIVSDCVADNDTLPFAHIRLPAAGWGEKDGTVTNSDRHVSRQRAFLPLGPARPDWWVICEVAKRMGFTEGFGFASAAQVFDEYARMTAVAQEQGMKLDLRGLAGQSPEQYDSMAPRQWPVPTAGVAVRPYADGRFSTPTGRARFVAVAARAPRHAPTAEYPLILNTGRIRDQWHTMTRTARAPALNAHEPEPYVDAHPQDLAAAGIVAGDLARVSTRWGVVLARARSSGDMPAGMLFMPIHWSGQFASDARVGAAVNPVVDALSGEPEFKHTPARLERVAVLWRGFLLSRRQVAPPDALWWSRSPGEGMQRLEFAGQHGAAPDRQWLQNSFPELQSAEWVEYGDAGTGSYRAALVQDGRLMACMMVARRTELPSRAWLVSLFAQPALEGADRSSLLRGRRVDIADPGPTVCACFGVGANTIRDAVHAGCGSVEAVGRRLRAGSNCGSCRPEIARLVTATLAAPAVPVPPSAAVRS